MPKKKEYIPINKGHFELDTKERSKEFSNKLAHGWEEEYTEYRQLWVELPSKKQLREYPLLVDLELSSVCNLKCPMCYTITDEFKKKVKKGFMDFELITKIIDEVADKVFALRLSLRGEPTLHPKFIDAIAYAKAKNIKEVSALTNGTNLDLENFKKFAEAGIDWFTISIDGTDENYNKIRKPLTFKNTLSKLKAILEYKESRGLIKPVIKAQGVWPAIRNNPTHYYNTLSPVTDLVAYNPLIDYLNKDIDIIYENQFACPQLYQRMVVCSDGKVVMCANDEDSAEVVGDAYKQSIYEIWHGEKMAFARKTHNRPDGFKSIPICKKCYYPRKAIPDERAMVGDREIWIENYINREQVIGK